MEKTVVIGGSINTSKVIGGHIKTTVVLELEDKDIREGFYTRDNKAFYCVDGERFITKEDR